MRRYLFVGWGALTLLTGCGGCGSGVSSSNIAKFSRTRLPEELDSVAVAPSLPAAIPPAAKPAADGPSAVAAANNTVISADDATPVAPAAIIVPSGPPRSRKVLPASQPLVIDADDPTPLPPPVSAAASQPAAMDSPAASSLPPGVIDADDPAPANRSHPSANVPTQIVSVAGGATPGAKAPIPKTSDLDGALAALHLKPRQPADPARIPAPSEEEQTETKRKLREIYRDELAAARTEEARQALARKLVADAERIKGESQTQYVLLLAARDLAAKSGELTVAMVALDQLESRFDVDMLAARVKTLVELNANLGRNAALNQRLAAETEKTLLEATERQDFDLALTLQGIWTEAARRLGDRQLAARLGVLKTELESRKREYQEVPGAAAKLEQDPSDPAANLIVGRYLCLVCSRWDVGLPLLAKGQDVRLKVLASIELGDKTPKAMVGLADEWWDLSLKSKPSIQRALVARAAHWYQQAIAFDAQGIERLRAEKRLGEAVAALAKEGYSLPGAPHPTGAAPTKSGATIIDAG
jgi:hypothetical protein